MGKKIINLYNCSQGELYAVCEIAWGSCRKHLDPVGGVAESFSGFSPDYTLLFIDERLAELAFAENLPDEETRSDKHETDKVLLEDKADDCLSKWRKLKRYIIRAFPKNLLKTKLEAAGKPYYLKASGDNWEVVELLMRTGSKFITDNLAVLGPKMTATFQTEFDTLKDEFAEMFLNFKHAQQTAFEETEAKITANNICYEALTLMLGDGTQIFEKHPALVKQFIFTNILRLVRGSASVTRTFIIPPSGFKVVKRVVANSKLENIGDTIIFYCKQTTACNADTAPFVNPGDEVTLNSTFDVVSITNPNAVEGKVRMRVTIH